MKLDDYKTRFVEFGDQPIGRGGYKEVFLARHSDYGKVVVKVFTNGVDDRALREIDLLRENEFYHVPPLYQTDVIECNGHETIATVEAFVEGKGLREVITSGQRYSFQETCVFLKQALTFADSIWKASVVHRDIKPENIIVSQEENYHFIDFGAARDLSSDTLTDSLNAMPCTIGYAAPEVLRNDPASIDSRADLFSIGVVSYELVTGENPYTKMARSPIQAAFNTLTVTPMQLSIVGDGQRRLIGLIASMMNRSRLSRPRDPKQALEFLEVAEDSYEEV